MVDDGNMLYCVHCSKMLPRSTFYRHKAKFFINDRWILEPELPETRSEDESPDENEAVTAMDCDMQIPPSADGNSNDRYTVYAVIFEGRNFRGFRC